MVYACLHTKVDGRCNETEERRQRKKAFPVFVGRWLVEASLLSGLLLYSSSMMTPWRLLLQERPRR